MVDDTRRAVIVTGLSAIGVGASSRSGSVTGGASIDAGEIELSDLELVDTNDNSLIGLDVLDDETIVARGVATNVGDVEEIFEIWLALELDGAWTDLSSKEFDIKAKEAQSVELSADLSNLAIDQDYLGTPVYLGGAEIGTIDLLQSGPNIQITGAWLIDGSGNRVESLTVQEGDPITAETDLTNEGTETGDQLLELTYGENTLDSATVTVDPGQEITQQLVGDAPQVDGDQEFTINVENQRAGDVTVEDSVPDSEGFEHNDLAANYGGETGYFSIQSGTVSEGTYALTNSDPEEFHSIVRTTGEGFDRYRLRLSWEHYGASGTSNPGMGTAFLTSADSFSNVSGYMFYTEPENGWVAIRRIDGGEITLLAGGNGYNLTTDAWIQCQVDMSSDGNFTFTVDGATVSTDSADETYQTGYLGFTSWNECYVDNVQFQSI